MSCSQTQLMDLMVAVSQAFNDTKAERQSTTHKFCGAVYYADFHENGTMKIFDHLYVIKILMKLELPISSDSFEDKLNRHKFIRCRIVVDTEQLLRALLKLKGINDFKGLGQAINRL